jgi:hypothetical protein
MTISLNTVPALLPLDPAQGEGDTPATGPAFAGVHGVLGVPGHVGEAISPLGPLGEVGDTLEELVDCPVPTSHEACEDGVAWQVAAFAETLRHDVASFRLRLAHWEPESRADAVVPPESFLASGPHARREGE